MLFFAHGILPESLAESVASYRRAIASADPIGLEVNNRLAGFCNALCLDDDREARELGGRASFDYVMKGMSLARWPEGVTPLDRRLREVHHPQPRRPQVAPPRVPGLAVIGGLGHDRLAEADPAGTSRRRAAAMVAGPPG